MSKTVLIVASQSAVRLLVCLVCLWSLGAAPARADNPKVMLTIAGRGNIVIELNSKEAPKTTAHFLDLVKKKFYDGILFHRVRKDFVAQAGDPKSKTVDGSKIRDLSDEEVNAKYGLGNGGSGQNIPFESNSLTNERGTIAMALSGPRSATGDSQFFLNLVPNTQLNGDYCVFGKVTKGLDVMDKVQQGDKIVTARVVAASGKPGKK